ncbi:hypothetical protein ALO88_200031 [Pseudomonas syringae pv. antirrhini]|uniref:Tail fiber assembly domain protein n=1 Tax=Pseudomonas syringae pv. antirrhini TaxID=251702 RepID=A0A0P9JB64_9PSED|nr:hypothetical protein ALO88_200031 [Pseudomonas syringae pv. antirrhini]
MEKFRKLRDFTTERFSLEVESRVSGAKHYPCPTWPHTFKPGSAFTNRVTGLQKLRHCHHHLIQRPRLVQVNSLSWYCDALDQITRGKYRSDVRPPAFDHLYELDALDLAGDAVISDH